MGVQISKILPKQELEINELSGKTLAVDAFLWLHQFLSIIRQRDGVPLKDSKGRITSHLTGLFYRSAKLLENNVKMVWVFDGEKPDLKTMTIEKRKEIKEEAYKKWIKELKQRYTIEINSIQWEKISGSDDNEDQNLGTLNSTNN